MHLNLRLAFILSYGHLRSIHIIIIHSCLKSLYRNIVTIAQTPNAMEAPVCNLVNLKMWLYAYVCTCAGVSVNLVALIYLNEHHMHKLCSYSATHVCTHIRMHTY